MSTSTNAKDLLQTAKDEGRISQESLRIITKVDLANTVQNALGKPADLMPISDAVLVSILMDNSGSMRDNQQIAIDGFNLVMEALKQSKQQDGILVQTWLLNGEVVYPFTDLMSIPVMDSQIYRIQGMTPLYSRTLEILAAAVAKQQELENVGVPSRSVTFIVSDGGDNASGSISEHDIHIFITDLLTDKATVERHIIGGMGIDDGYTNFEDVFRGMGLESSWILTPQNNKSEIRKAFQLLSQLALKASQSIQDFSQSAGFTS